MHHVLAFAALQHAAPGTFKVMGHKVPVLLGEILHGIAKFAKIIMAVLILILLLVRGGVKLWEMIIILAVGMFVIPGTFKEWSKITASINKGSALGSTGASLGMIALEIVLLGATLFLLRAASKKMAAAAAAAAKAKEKSGSEN
jgi:cbb3-type cytochrome oxidase subunit 3